MAEGLQPLFSRFAGTGDKHSQRTLLIFAAVIFPIVGLNCYFLVLFDAKAFMGIFAPGDSVLVQFAADRCPGRQDQKGHTDQQSKQSAHGNTSSVEMDLTAAENWDIL